MTLLQAIILGIVQGLTEFIPISSSAHLIIASRLTGLYEGVEADLRNQQTTATIAVIQLGTLVAVLAYFAPDLWNMALCFIRDHLAWLRGQPEVRTLPMNASAWQPAWMSDETWLGWLVILGSIPIGAVGFVLKKYIEGPTTKNLWIIATMLIIVALLLLVAEKVSTHARGMNQLGVFDALLVGFAQVLSLMPGSSRSGVTIMAGLFAGQQRAVAARFSFLLSIPAILASGLFELREVKAHLPGGNYGALAVATVVAGVIGYASIAFLLRFLRTNSTGVFIGYRLVLGLLIFGLLLNGVINQFGDRLTAHAAPTTQTR
jgi:undecaprenyl-diphosphatase